MTGSKKKTDEELIELLRGEDLNAFNELYARYWNPLLAKALDRLQSREDAEEVLQEVFVNLWNRRTRLQLRSTFRTYIYAALKYEILHQVSKALARQNEVLLDDTALLKFLDTDESFFSIEIKELQAQIEKEIDSLPERCRIIFKMSRNEGKNIKEIAGTLQISGRTVETQISKALKILRKSLGVFIYFI